MKAQSHKQARREASATTPPRLPHTIQLAILALLLATAVVAVHWPVLSAKALSFDDQQYLTSNPLVQQPGWTSAGRFLGEVLRPSTVPGYYQPLAMISLMLDYAVAGSVDNLRSFHATSLALHVANTILVMLLLYALFGRPWIAAAVALLFGLHPMTVETIAWVGERKTVLASFFALLCLLVYIRYTRKGGAAPYICCLLLYILALMSKPTTTLLPVVLLLLDFWPLNRLNWRTLIEKLPFFAICGLSAIITVASQAATAAVQMPGQQSFWRIPLIICHDIVFYPCKILWPTNLTSSYPIPDPLSLANPTILAGVIGSCLLVAALVASLRWTRAPLTGWLVFLVAIFPTMGVIGFTIVLTSDKYAYLPAVGFLIVLAWAFDRLAASATPPRSAWRPAVLGASVLLVSASLAISTRACLAEWQTGERHNLYMLRLAPNSAHVRNNCGYDLEMKGDYPGALYHYNRAIEFLPTFPDAYNNRANTYNRMGDLTQAIHDYSKAIELKPAYPDAYHNRAVAYYRSRQFDKALQDLQKCQQLDGRPNPDVVRAITEAARHPQ